MLSLGDTAAERSWRLAVELGHGGENVSALAGGERCFSKLKQFRAVATRYDKRERI